MTTVKIFKCNTHADIRDYEQLAVDQKAIDAIIQNCNFKVVFKEGESASIVPLDPHAE